MTRSLSLGLIVGVVAVGLAGCFNRNQQCMRPAPPCCPVPDPCCTPAPILQGSPTAPITNPPPPPM